MHPRNTGHFTFYGYDKNTIVPVHSMKTCGGSGGRGPLILHQFMNPLNGAYLFRTLLMAEDNTVSCSIHVLPTTTSPTNLRQCTSTVNIPEHL